ncbi:MAG: tetratricopeptide (TPR) repeat protein [Parvicellaceae bacterium]|jgi:tetratricopeptide (TPR) repeat protein
MSEENIEEEVTQTEAVEQVVEDAEGEQKPLLDKNGKILGGVLVAVIVIFGGYWGYQKFISEPAELAAHEDLWYPEAMLHFNEDYESAIQGDTGLIYEGFANIVDEIDGTQAGLIAKYDLGIAYLNNDEYALARETLNGVDFGDVMVTTVVKGAIGDSYMQENDANNALKYYSEAVANSDNSFTCPIYLKKSGFANEILGNYNEAVALYERIKTEFPISEEARTIDKYIVKAKSKV